jgi:hypothetical protein
MKSAAGRDMWPRASSLLTVGPRRHRRHTRVGRRGAWPASATSRAAAQINDPFIVIRPPPGAVWHGALPCHPSCNLSPMVHLSMNA